MRKIKSISQLKQEKKRIKQQQTELENKIRGNWIELKESLNPANIAKEAYSKVMDNKAEANLSGDNVFKSTLNYGITLLAKKFTDKAGEKLDRLFKKKAGDGSGNM